jgi:hypothetical protein
MAGKGKKTFVAGEVLVAQDVNEYLMDQSVMNFASSAARASAIPTPSAGMTSYISTTGTASIPQLETYTGSAWQTPYGMTLLSTAILSGASLTIENVFSATYDSYQIVLSNVRTSGAVLVWFRVGTTATGYYGTSIQSGAGYTTPSGNAVFFNQSNAAQLDTSLVSGSTTTTTGGGTITVQNPFLAISTTIQCMASDPRTDGQGRFATGAHLAATSFTSFTIGAGGGTFSSGNVRVYGLRNS